MRDSFDVFEYMDYVVARWRIPAIAVGVAVVLAIVVSLILPKRYTASAAILIDPPGANDVRTATAVSPVYLESLRSFEHFAASDKLFADAVQRFHLQDAQGRPSIETLKSRVLRVSKPRDIKVLEISVTLADPKLAYDVVSYIAEQTVRLNRTENVAADNEMLEQARHQATAAEDRLTQVRRAAGEDARLETPDTLKSNIDVNLDTAAKIRQEFVDAETNAAEFEQTSRNSDPGAADHASYARHQLPGAKARVEVLRKTLAEIDGHVDREKRLLSKRVARRTELDADLRAAQAASDAASARLRELEGISGNRGERLRIIDPGIVPQRPTSPNMVLNTVVALLIAAVFSTFYLTAGFVRARKSATLVRPSVRGGMSA